MSPFRVPAARRLIRAPFTGRRGPRTGPGPVGLTVVLPVACVVVAAVDVLLVVTAGRQPVWRSTWEIGAPLVWVGVGAVARVLHPQRRVGWLMQVLGLVLLLDAPAGFVLVTSETWVAVDLVVARAVQPFQIVVFAHLLLAYPEGHLRSPLERRFTAALYGYGGLVGARDTAATIAAVTGAPWRGAVPEAGFAGGGSSVPVNAGWIAFAAGYLVLLLLKVRDVTPGKRRVLAYPLVCGIAVVVLFLGATVLLVRGGRPTANPLSESLPYLAMLTMPGAFLLGLLRERLRYGSIADFVRAIEGAPIGQLRAALREALHDPGLELAFYRDGRYVTEHGEPVSPPAGGEQAVLPIGGDPPVGLVLHDPALNDEPKLLAAASAATRLALDNARLHALVRRQLGEVRASRRRIVEAAAEERRRLERDLHDGVQQRMLSVGLALRLLEHRLEVTDPAVAKAFDDVRGELATAIAELRELARGIHPEVLTTQGLSAAVRSLARRQPFAVVVVDDLPRRLPPAVESAAYYVVAEALTNVVKHARAGSVRVRLTADDAVLRVEVRDDGTGGAAPDRGTGLRGLADRVAAFDGTLSVADAVPSGTVLVAELKLSSHGFR